MRNLTIILIYIILSSCTFEKGDITDEMKKGLISFKQETISDFKNENDSYGKVIEERNNGILTLSFITEETGCPYFEGGYKIENKILTLYYQDVNLQLVKCIDFFKLEYKIRDVNLEYEKIKIVKLNPIKKGFSFKE